MKMIDLKEIAIAWHRAANPTPEQKELADHRLNICDGCEHKQFKALIRTYVCGACGCPLSKKIYSPNPGNIACPKEKWDR
jgi:ribosomal protein L37E